MEGFEFVNPPVQGRPEHSQVLGDLDRRFAAVDQPPGQDQAPGELLPAAAKVLARGAAFGNAVVDPFPFDLQLHLRQRGHHGKGHAAHRGDGIDVPAAQVQDKRTCLCRVAGILQLLDERISHAGEPVNGVAIPFGFLLRYPAGSRSDSLPDLFWGKIHDSLISY